MAREIPLTRGKVAIVDDDMFDFLNQWKWHCTANGYAARADGGRKNRQILFMHRVILDAPTGFHVDHVDHDGLNNQRQNIRIATPSQNHYNARCYWGNSKYKGVHYSSSRRAWVAATQIEGRKIHLGSFTTERSAAEAYNQAVAQLHGEFALLNDLSDHVEPQVAIRPDATSPYRGVYFAKDRNKWRAVIKLNGKLIHLGTFATEEEAAAAYEKASTLPH